jgi:hypothetical protein
MHETGGRPDVFGEVGEKGDHVMARLLFYLVDALDLEGASACASAAWASISNQMRKRFSGSQMRAISGRL